MCRSTGRPTGHAWQNSASNDASDLGRVKRVGLDRSSLNLRDAVLSQYVEPVFAMRLIEDHPERCGYLLGEGLSSTSPSSIDALRRIDDGDTG